MAPRILIYLTVVLSGVFTLDVPVDCLANSAEDYQISAENQMQKPLTNGGQQIVEQQAALAPVNYRRVIFYSKPRAMYASNLTIVEAEEVLAVKGLIKLDKENAIAEEIMAEIARTKPF